MTRQTWRSIIGAWLCAGLFSGCAQGLFPFTLLHKKKAIDPKVCQEDPPPQGSVQGDQPSGGLVSPYGMLNYPTGRPKRDPQFSIWPQTALSEDGARRPDGSPEEQEPQGVGAIRPPPPGPPPRSVGAAQPVVPPPQPPEPWVLALRCILKDQPEQALTALKPYDPARQVLILRLLPILAELSGGADKLSPEKLEVIHKQVQGLLSELLARSELVIARACYCVPEPQASGEHAFRALRPDHQFLPPFGRRPGEQVFLSVELRNLSGARRGEWFEARVSSFLKIADGRGKEFGKCLDEGKVPLRRSTFAGGLAHVYSFYVPELPPGRYQLTLVVRDESTQPARPAETTLPFVVAADPAAN
jgi:hypothetical protein